MTVSNEEERAAFEAWWRQRKLSAIEYPDDIAFAAWQAALAQPTAVSPDRAALANRITHYLSGGGIFVRDLLIECRDALASSPEPSEPAPAVGQTFWRCFHCDECFTDKAAALTHFGNSERQSPICTIDAAEYRSMEERMRRYNDEDSDLHRAVYAAQSEGDVKAKRAEEQGYARGLADAKKHPEELGLQVAAPAVGAEPVAWWNGLRRHDPEDLSGPSFSEDEDTWHDIPVYSGVNPCNVSPAPAGVVEAPAAEIAALVADAERYRWLRDRITFSDKGSFSDPNGGSGMLCAPMIRRWYHDSNVLTETTLDLAIDTARSLPSVQEALKAAASQSAKETP